MTAKNKNININERSVGEYKVPDEVYNANWRDDIEDQAKEEDNIKKEFEFYSDEISYDSRKSRDIDRTRIKRFGAAKRLNTGLMRTAIRAAMKSF